MENLFCITRNNIPGHGETKFYLDLLHGMWVNDIQHATKFTKDELAITLEKRKEIAHLYIIELLE